MFRLLEKKLAQDFQTWAQDFQTCAQAQQKIAIEIYTVPGLCCIKDQEQLVK